MLFIRENHRSRRNDWLMTMNEDVGKRNEQHLQPSREQGMCARASHQPYDVAPTTCNGIDDLRPSHSHVRTFNHVTYAFFHFHTNLQLRHSTFAAASMDSRI